MARSTVIDSLLVVLGLDAKPFKKGSDEADREQKKLRDQTKKSFGEMSDAIKGTAMQIGALVLGFESIKGGISFLAGVNDADAALGRLAKDAGVSVHELNTWGLAVHDIGGDAKEAQGAVSQLSKELTLAKTGGELGPLLQFLQRIGVSLQDSSGKARNMLELLDAAGVAMRSRDRTTMVNLAQQSGLGENITRLLLTEDAARKQIFATAEKNNSLNERGAEQAAKMQAEWRSLIDSAVDFGRAINNALFPAVMAFFNALAPVKPLLIDIINSLKDAGAFEGLAHGITHAAEALQLAIKGWRELISLMPAAEKKAANAFEIVADFEKSIPGLVRLDRIIGRAIGMYDDTPEEAGHGVRTPRVIEAQASQARRQAAYAARQSGPTSAGGNSTDVHIDRITINTQATDANGIAAELPGALRRKGVVAQADSGMN